MEIQEQNTRNHSVVTVGDWILTMILMLIPIVNFIMLLVWAFSSSTPASKSNWAKATLIFMLLGALLTFLFWGSIASLMLVGM
ncbi:MAG TPA: hypothetical protein H9863_07005 [Candidatus Odoribacter faecigallinarum]|uniref:Uncharacterized protein n=1 Tax=Candidatus Odoribacter faecigallinarum TaxID=2838706 RepID=A0A9D1V0J6_9BACT|nr:hypothetical protein [Candidatus Odoribacter faecigallinarum]